MFSIIIYFGKYVYYISKFAMSNKSFFNYIYNNKTNIIILYSVIDGIKSAIYISDRIGMCNFLKTHKKSKDYSILIQITDIEKTDMGIFEIIDKL